MKPRDSKVKIEEIENPSDFRFAFESLLMDLDKTYAGNTYIALAVSALSSLITLGGADKPGAPAEYFRFQNRNMTDEAKISYLLDNIIYELLKSKIGGYKDSTNTYQTGYIEDQAVRSNVAKRLEELSQQKVPVPAYDGETIMIGLQPVGYRDQLKQTKSGNTKETKKETIPLSIVIDATIDKLIEDVGKDSKLKNSFVMTLLKIRKERKTFSKELAEVRTSGEKSPQIKQALDEYEKQLDEEFKKKLSKVPLEEQAKLRGILSATIEGLAEKKVDLEERKLLITNGERVLNKYFDEQSIRPGAPESTKLFERYHYLLSDFLQLAALSDLKSKSKENIAFSKTFQNALSFYFRLDVLTKYASKAATRFFNEISVVLKGTDPELAKQITPQNDPDYQLSQLKKEIEAYRKMRKAEAEVAGKTEESHYLTTTFFGAMHFGLSAGVKIKAVEALEHILGQQGAPALKKLEIEALTKGRLGIILEKYKDALPWQVRWALYPGYKVSPKLSLNG